MGGRILVLAKQALRWGEAFGLARGLDGVLRCHGGVALDVSRHETDLGAASLLPGVHQSVRVVPEDQ